MFGLRSRKMNSGGEECGGADITVGGCLDFYAIIESRMIKGKI